MDVSKNRGTPKWMVYNGKPYEQMEDLGVPLFLETLICGSCGNNITCCPTWQFCCDFWWNRSPFALKRLLVGDLQLGNKKVTLNHLVFGFGCFKCFLIVKRTFLAGDPFYFTNGTVKFDTFLRPNASSLSPKENWWRILRCFLNTGIHLLGLQKSES